MAKIRLDAFQKVVTTAATQVVLKASATWATHVVIRALKTNTTAVYIGYAAGVSATTGMELSPGESFTFPITERIDLATIGLDAATNGEGVCVSYLSEIL